MRMMLSVGMFVAMLLGGVAHSDEAKPARTQSFLFGLNDGERVNILSHGPLTLFARCELVELPEGRNGVDVLVTSDMDGWIAGSNGDPLLAGEESPISHLDQPPNNGRAVTTTSGGFAIAPTGEVMLPSDILVAVNVGEFDCFVGGSVVNLKGDIF